MADQREDMKTLIRKVDELTASAITYKMQMRVGGGTGYLGRTWAEANNANWGPRPGCAHRD